ncbi:MAG TPA: amino acid adenylation domain-containing protein [Candidatus Eisenbacteria bacterium]|nr:amino acid adenylation domain-containing protein [Candidatus Eisenbacteria bacterium]
MPLSSGQQRLWLIDRLAPRSPEYNLSYAARLKGRLDIAALEKTLTEIIRRHESLRTTFVADGGVPYQVIRSASPFTLPLIDLTDLTPAEREHALYASAVEEALKGFDLERDLLFRAKLLRLGEQEHVLSYTFHHIASDGWSLGVFYRELDVLYKAFSAGWHSPLPELALQYADYALWQRQWLETPARDTQLVYWKRHLEHLSMLELPTRGPRPPLRTFRGVKRSMALGKPLTDSLQALGRAEGATSFMIFLAAFAVLLHRYTGQADVVVGSPIAGRQRPELRSLIGFFVNTLIMRVDLSGDPVFRELLRQAREVCLGAYRNQDLPFDYLLNEMHPDRNLSHNPLFQVMLAVQNAPVSLPHLPGLTIEPVRFERGNTRFDLEVHIVDRPEGLASLFVHNPDLFDDNMIARMQREFHALLEEVARRPERRVSELARDGGPERRLSLDWSRSHADSVIWRSVRELFEAQVERTPELPAAVFNAQPLTYRELNHRANRLAWRLRSLGAGPEVLVGIYMERGFDLLVGILGALKSGAACLPLDPALPDGRLAYMLEDAKAPLLLTLERSLERLLEHRGSGTQPGDSRSSIVGSREVLLLDADSERSDRLREDNPPGSITADNLAYVIYTSGSTGRPKGVGMSHGPLSNLIAWQIRNSVTAAPTRTLQFAAPAFDVSFQEIFSTLCAGGTLVLIADEARRDVKSLLQVMRENEVDRAFLPPAALQELAWASAALGVSVPTLRDIIAAGEQLHVTPEIRRFLSGLDGCSLRNQYGPSETHVVTEFTLKGSVADWPALPAIGRPIANTEIYILDSSLRPVPVGVTGELHVAGAGLSRGYVHAPSLTAEKFIPNPFDETPGARLYKTGDLARYLPDGNIQFLGRRDDQLKIRGFRVEPGEVEAALKRHPGVANAAVIGRQDETEDRESKLLASINPAKPPGKVEEIENRKSKIPTEAGRGIKYLVAYIEAAQNPPPDSIELRRFLRTKLPDYMIPSRFVLLESLPLSANGKIDRRALPLSDRAMHPAAPPEAEPRNAVESAVASIWADILDLRRVSIHDNFFDLGGHSLLATRVISRLADAFGVELPLRAIFENPTVASLAEAVSTAGAQGRGAVEAPADGGAFDGAARAKAPENFQAVSAEHMTTILDELESLTEEQADAIVSPERPKKKA